MSRRLLPLLFLGCLPLAGCLQHRSAWEPFAVPPPRVEAELPAALETARQATRSAGDAEAVEEALAAWRRVLGVDPSNLEALIRLGNLELLSGAAYAATESEKERRYLASMKWSERALYTLPAFRARVDGGEPLWRAVDAVGDPGMEPMIKWVTAVFYLYEDTLSSLGRLLNVRWLERAQRVMERMSAVDADWGPGVLRFSWGIFYVALPPVAGGDREKAAEELAAAIELDPRRLLFRWGRGRYLHVQTANRPGFVEDLEWVLRQDPREATGPYAWNVYFQRDARRLLDSADRLFPADTRRGAAP